MPSTKARGPALCPGERSQILHRIVDAIEARQDELSDIEMRNAGSTWRKAFLMDIPVGVLHFRHFAKLADYEPLEPVPQITFPMRSYNFVQREPIGVCGQIIPWNFPFLMAVWKMAPALAAGNAVVLKPASLTPLSALKLVEIIHETGLLPPGVLNLVTGPGAAIGHELATNPLVDKIAFTGSTEVGREVMRQAAGTIKKVTLELGGKSPSIVLDDADLDVTIDGCLWATFMHNGQACESGTRLFVPAIIYDSFMERLLDRASRIRVGLPADGETDLGPLISAAQLRRVEEYIRIGLAEGATPALLGSRPADPDWPTATSSRPRSSPMCATICASPRKRSSGRCSRSSSTIGWKRRSAWRTTRSTAWPRACGAATSTGQSKWPSRSAPAPSGSTTIT